MATDLPRNFIIKIVSGVLGVLGGEEKKEVLGVEEREEVLEFMIIEGKK